MAIAFGETWSNRVQPFRVQSALAVARLGVRDIMGCCVTALRFSSVVLIAGLYLFQAFAHGGATHGCT